LRLAFAGAHGGMDSLASPRPALCRVGAPKALGTHRLLLCAHACEGGKPHKTWCVNETHLPEPNSSALTRNIMGNFSGYWLVSNPLQRDYPGGTRPMCTPGLDLMGFSRGPCALAVLVRCSRACSRPVLARLSRASSHPSRVGSRAGNRESLRGSRSSVRVSHRSFSRGSRAVLALLSRSMDTHVRGVRPSSFLSAPPLAAVGGLAPSGRTSSGGRLAGEGPVGTADQRRPHEWLTSDGSPRMADQRRVAMYGRAATARHELLTSEGSPRIADTIGGR
jgi:hypothetical protein